MQTFIFWILISCISSLRANFHPLDPLSGDEIQTAVQTIQNVATSPNQYIFNYIALQEPRKSELLPSFLEDLPLPPLPRKAFLILMEWSSQDVFEAVVNVDLGFLESFTLIPIVRAPMTPKDFLLDELDFVLRDARVQRRCAELGYPDIRRVTGVPNYLPLIRGEEADWTTTRREVEYFLFGTNFPGDNYHAHPFDFIVLYDTVLKVVVKLKDLPTHSDFSTNNTGNKAPMREGNFDYKLRGGKDTLRNGDKPIYTVSPEGVSYTIRGHEISWQKWKMRVGFNGREGLTLHMVSYQDSGRARPILYRAAMAELFVPYADPRPPNQKTQFFDLGEYGLGYKVDSHKTSEESVVAATFLDVCLHSSDGAPKFTRNAISVREEDAGILWKHVDFRTQLGRVARSHVLVVSATYTANNYDYSFSWKFYQDGSIQFEVLLLGILYTTMVSKGSGGGGYGTLVAPQVSGPFHYHFFTVRLDMEIDGTENSVVTQDVVRVEDKTGSRRNPYGQGFTRRLEVMRTASEGRSKIDPEKGRIWVVTNPNVINSVTGGPVGWKLMPSSVPPFLAKEDSPYRERPGWVEWNLWVSPYREEELYPGGRYLNRSGLPEWLRNDPDAGIENQDVVLWHTFGVCHITRPEDWPIMPVESIGFWLKPYNFFGENPAIDVPPGGVEDLELF